MYPSTGSGNITTQNIGAPTGNAVTAGSTVIALSGGADGSANIQVRGTYTGALSVQVTLDGDLWVTLTSATALTNMATGVQSATIASAAQGIWQVDTTGVVGVRVTALAAMTGTATVTIVSGLGSSVVTIDNAITLAAGAAAIGTVTANIVQPTATLLSINLNSAATTNATSQKTTTGSVFELTASNMSAAIKYVKFYNKASAPTVGTDVPVLTIPVPANGMISLEFGANGKKFITGIAFAITGAQAIADATAVAAGDVQVHGTYI